MSNTISIIITSHNQPELIKRCLDSIGGRIDGVEIIVSDDASTDNTVDVAKSYPFVQVLANKQWSHAGGARNKGAAIANGKYLWFFDGDDTFVADKIPMLVKFASASVADVITIDYTTHYRDHDEEYHYPQGVGDEFLPNIFVCPWGKIIKREKFVPFAECCHYQDMDWWYAQADELDTVDFFRECVMIYDRTVEGQSMSAVEYAWKNKRLDGRHGLKPYTLAQWVMNEIPQKDGQNVSNLADRYALCARMWKLLLSLKKEPVRFALRQAFIRSFGDSVCP